MMLKDGRYRIGDTVYRTAPESPDGCCLDECDIKGCTHDKDFQSFLRDCNAKCCIQILGIGRIFKKVQ